ncbi:polysaccharide deacetylase family protein [Geodermatophilus sp. SYSU D00698]
MVLLYHRISEDESDDPGGMVVPPSLFREHMTALSDWFSVVPARGILSGHGEPAAAVTLDDGYLDNLEQAVPVLQEFSLPATFFVVADALAGDGRGPVEEYWWDRLEHLLLEHGSGGNQLDVQVGRRMLRLDLANADSRRLAYWQLSAALYRQPPAEVRRVVRVLETVRPRAATCMRHRRMTVEQVQRLAEDPMFTIGSHTCSHAALAQLRGEEARRELTQSRDALRAILGESPELLAYPFGAPGTVTRRNAQEARAAGYHLAFANVAGPVDGADPFAVPRITVGRWSVDRLRRAVTAWVPAA